MILWVLPGQYFIVRLGLIDIDFNQLAAQVMAQALVSRVLVYGVFESFYRFVVAPELAQGARFNEQGVGVGRLFIQCQAHKF